MTSVLVEAVWFGTRNEYVCDAERRGGSWYSADGDEWHYLNGSPVDSAEFAVASIRLIGGPRDGVVVN